ncbi:hypothetical protein BGW38_001366 [Lunasporangiospora selenospora]|uniref:Armadillo-like helical domain-containing protein n=1 Tax=Lunasporangiospora selenospora TaxID=979761 RepID=A0A9P6G195_9FUNG|nr:hypothetical protein BGW38_001366 [Lunasporangiospora selenospora]
MQEMKIGPSTATEHLLRPQTGQRMKLKEKFVAIYDMFLRGQDPIQGKDSEMFWDELFLIKVNTKHLSSSLRQIGEDQLLAIKDEINSIFLHAVNAVTDPLPQRRLHAMQTLTILLSEIFRKKFNNWSFDVIHLLTGLSQADYVFGVLLQGLDSLLGNEAPLELRTAALRLAITIASGNDNVNKNSLNEYFMQKDLFTSLAKFLVSVDDDDLAFEVMTLLGLLANYNKYEIQNPYLIQLADLNDDAIFHKMSMVLAHKFDDMQRDYTEVMDDDDPSTVSRVASALSYVSGMLWNPKGQDTTSTGATFAFLPNGKATVLLVFYDLIHNNKRFLRVFLNYSTPELSMATPQTMGDKTEDPKNSLDGKDTALGSFLSFVSYLSQHNRTPRTAPYTQLCLIIVQIIVEDPSSYQHLCIIPQSQDSTPTTRALRANPMASVRLCRQRQPVLPKAKQARPMAAVVLDVVLGFLKHNMKKKLQVDCFRIAVAIIFALASRFRSLRVRLPYHWAEMWNTIQGLVKFLHANATGLQYNIEARDLIAEAIDLVNYFATYGDLLMPDPGSLYALYYEIVRTGIDPFIELAKEWIDFTCQTALRRQDHPNRP